MIQSTGELFDFTHSIGELLESPPKLMGLLWGRASGEYCLMTMDAFNNHRSPHVAHV